jgi:non-heme Fe2+,alpha-ketoglutarate-dependent halogenase
MIKEIYNSSGYYGPVQFLNETEIELYTAQLLKAVEQIDLMNSDYRCKSNVLFPWIDTLSRNVTVLSHVKEILGENVHCWDTLIWIKDAESNKFVSWHQDATYWNFMPKNHGLTVWVTLSEATENMGCIEYIPGSHKELKHHVDIKNDNNLLMRGQTIENLDKTLAVKVPAPAGSFLIHHPFMFHGSSANKTKIPRLSLGLIYASTDVKPIATYAPESTIMVSGKDTYNYMQHDTPPTGNWDTNIESWKAAYKRQHDNYYKMQQLA